MIIGDKLMKSLFNQVHIKLLTFWCIGNLLIITNTAVECVDESPSIDN